MSKECISEKESPRDPVGVDAGVSHCIYLTVNVLAGTDINSACKEACELADKLGITIDFKFNGVTCIAHPGANYFELVGKWYLELATLKQYKFAVAG